MSPHAAFLDETSARSVLLVRAYDAVPDDHPLWTPQDRAWATQVATETTPTDGADVAFVLARAMHALKRLLPRDPVARRLLERRRWRGRWCLLGALGAMLLGVEAGGIGASQHINLLAPPIWAVVGWNLAVYLVLLVAFVRSAGASGGPVGGSAGWRGLRASLTRRLAGVARAGPVPAAFAAAWARAGAPLFAARAALLLHTAAAGLALGLIGGLYLRGLVLDYRAGWQSTFLDAGQVRAVLAVLLAPASMLTGIAVPDAQTMQSLRIGPDAAPVALAGPWLHLMAATLAIFVVVPRSALGLFAGWRAKALARRLPLPLGDAYYQRLLRQWHRQPARVQVLPHGATPGWQALAGLKQVLAEALGPELQLQVEATTAHGDEDLEALAAARAASAGTSLSVLLVDLASTPENEVHGRFVSVLRAREPAPPLLLVADESGWRTRFASLPGRIAERRVTWQRWADAQQLGFVGVALDRPDPPSVAMALEQALTVEPGAPGGPQGPA